MFARKREITLGQIRKTLKQRGGDYEIENAITQEFQALIVGSTVAPMCQGRFQQPLIGKDMTKFSGNGLRSHAL